MARPGAPSPAARTAGVHADAGVQLAAPGAYPVRAECPQVGRATATPARTHQPQAPRRPAGAASATGGEHRHDPGQRDQRQRRRRRVDGASAELAARRRRAAAGRGRRPRLPVPRGRQQHARPPPTTVSQQRSRERSRSRIRGTLGATGRSVSAVAIACSTARALFRVSAPRCAGIAVGDDAGPGLHVGASRRRASPRCGSRSPCPCRRPGRGSRPRRRRCRAAPARSPRSAPSRAPWARRRRCRAGRPR